MDWKKRTQLLADNNALAKGMAMKTLFACMLVFAAAIGAAEKKVGPGRVRWVHPDCGFWMLKRSIADRKIEALARGRDRYLGRA